MKVRGKGEGEARRRKWEEGRGVIGQEVREDERRSQTCRHTRADTHLLLGLLHLRRRVDEVVEQHRHRDLPGPAGSAQLTATETCPAPSRHPLSGPVAVPRRAR